MIEIITPTEYSNVDEQKIEETIYIGLYSDYYVRNKFISKVYWLLTLQLLITLIICTIFMKVENISTFVLGNINILYFDIGMTFITLIILICFQRSYPINLVLLHIFTVEISYMIGTLCASLKDNSDIVLMAFGATSITFICLSSYVHISKIDFSFLNGFLFTCLNCLIIWSIFILIFGFQTSYLYCIFGMFIFSGYILYDTSLIIYKLSIDDYVLAVLMLYLDFINLFIKMLECLGKINKLIK